MDTKQITAEYRLSQWVQILQARRESGQSIKDFCDSTGINRNAYFYWQRKLRTSACTELSKSDQPITNTPNGWIELTADPVQQEKSELAIEIKDCRIMVSDDTDPGLLQKVCRILRSL